MKLGFENKKKAITAVGLLLVGMVASYQGLSAPVVASRPRKTSAPPRSASPAKPRPHNDAHHYIACLLEPTLDPHLRLDLLAGTEGIKYEGSGRNIFQEEAPDNIPQPIAPAVLTSAKPVQVPPPTRPPINLKFWGWASSPGEPKAVFLAQGESGFVAHEGDVVARRYKVLKINANSVEIEDVLSNNRQNLPVAF
jgi:hypothetical protein